MIEIVDGLYLGNREAARDLRRLRVGGITHIVNCAEELPNYFEGQFNYLALRLLDPDPQLAERLPEALRFIDEARRERGKVLVHCYAAVSRSPSVMLAYLCHVGRTLEEAAAHLGNVVWSDPDWLFLRQIAQHHDETCDEPRLQCLSELLQGRPRGS
ncbi:MAG: dual specificity protein phosphatase [Gemmataceae bacterium]